MAHHWLPVTPLTAHLHDLCGVVRVVAPGAGESSREGVAGLSICSWASGRRGRVWRCQKLGMGLHHRLPDLRGGGLTVVAESGHLLAYCHPGCL